MLADLSLERNDGLGTGGGGVDFAPAPADAVGQNRTLAYFIAGTVGAAVLLFSVIGDSLGAGTEGFGRLQSAGLIGGLLLLDAGVIALRGQSERFRASWSAGGPSPVGGRLATAGRRGPGRAGGSRP